MLGSQGMKGCAHVTVDTCGVHTCREFKLDSKDGLLIVSAVQMERK